MPSMLIGLPTACAANPRCRPSSDQLRLHATPDPAWRARCCPIVLDGGTVDLTVAKQNSIGSDRLATTCSALRNRRLHLTFVKSSAYGQARSLRRLHSGTPRTERQVTCTAANRVPEVEPSLLQKKISRRKSQGEIPPRSMI